MFANNMDITGKGPRKREGAVSNLRPTMMIVTFSEMRKKFHVSNPSSYYVLTCFSLNVVRFSFYRNMVT